MLDFHRLAPWQWMFDSNLFAVRNPFGDEVGYCCVLGNLGEVFGLVVYVGAEGYEYHQRVLSEEWTVDDAEIVHRLDCIQAFFEDREDLDAPDRKLVAKSGVRFRGRRAWPSIRRYRPGLAPWYATSEEAAFLTCALRQAIAVAEKCLRDPDCLIPPRPGQLLLREPRRTGQEIEWTERWIDPPAATQRVLAPPRSDTSEIERVKRLGLHRAGTWEFDCLYAPIVLTDAERPYCPMMGLWVDRESGFVLNVALCETADHSTELCEQTLRLFDLSRQIPETILVRHDEARVIVEHLARALGFRVVESERLDGVDAAFDGMRAFMKYGERL
ncbi:hypothetical protein JW916_05185 [Candidatus Sumerlaeota bacterium]|nr:hypothetical protein [Candidatus Sumerlaeota bacterium]